MTAYFRDLGHVGLPSTGIVCGMLEYLNLNIWSVCVCVFILSQSCEVLSPQPVKVLIISFFDPVSCRNLRVEVRVEIQPSQRDSALLSRYRLREFWDMYFYFGESKWDALKGGF